MENTSATVDAKGRVMIGRGGDLTNSKRLAAVKLVVPDDHFDENGSPKPAESVNGWTVFCTNFNKECGIDDMQDLFSDYGNVQSIKVEFDQITMESRGYFLVKYKEKESADAAIEALNGSIVHGKTIKVEYAFRCCPDGYVVEEVTVDDESRKRMHEGSSNVSANTKEANVASS